MTSAIMKAGGSNPDPFWDVVKPIAQEQSRDYINPYVADVLAISDHIAGRTHEPDLLATDGVLLWAFSEKQHAKSVAATPVVHVPAVKPESKRERAADVGFSLYYRVWWIFLAFVGAIWGGFVGASITGALAMGVITTVIGTVVLVGLMATLFVAGRRSSRIDG